ncbi:MAG: T9SS type A sorting domain-containing protein [Bacteroidales bacterium]|nr:T9SS type A sorting domain-containing protein [Bacteroidales bacterium]
MKKMAKKIGLLLLSLLAFVPTHGQDTAVVFQSVFGDSSSTWYVYLKEFSIYADATDVKQAVAGDSVFVDSNVYNVLRRDYSESTEGISVFYHDSILLRENETHSKLYIKQYYNGTYEHIPEILVMDLDLNVGDTLNTENWDKLELHDFDTIPTIRIDSIFFENGRKILKTNFHNRAWFNDIDTLMFIEGVGPSLGPEYPRRMEHVELLCYYRDGVEVYHDNPGDEGCLKGGGIFDNIELCEWDFFCEVFPNPCADVVYIDATEATGYMLLSSNGRLIQTSKLPGRSTAIDMHDYARGIYFIILTGAHHLCSRKIIKL